MSTFSWALELAFPVSRMTRRLNKLAEVGPGIVVKVDDQRHGLGARDIFSVTVRREGQAIVVGCDLAAIYNGFREVVPVLARRPALFVKLLAAADESVAGFSGTVGDVCAGGLVGYSSCNADAVLVPDGDFFAFRGYEGARKMARDNKIPWTQRSGEILWRGQTTGAGLVAEEWFAADNPRLVQRVRMCLLLSGIPGVDAGFAGKRQPRAHRVDHKRLQDAGVLRNSVPLSEWSRRKFAIDVDGFSNAWSNLFNRLLLGCCVIKVGSQYGFKQWYYDDLVPWRHYVPVKPDMSDLVEKIEWCREHLDECEAIAAGGQKLAMAMTFESEMARGAAAINRAFAGKALG